MRRNREFTSKRVCAIIRQRRLKHFSSSDSSYKQNSIAMKMEALVVTVFGGHHRIDRAAAPQVFARHKVRHLAQ
jgi:hypothetical protein